MFVVVTRDSCLMRTDLVVETGHEKLKHMASVIPHVSVFWFSFLSQQPNLFLFFSLFFFFFFFGGGGKQTSKSNVEIVAVIAGDEEQGKEVHSSPCTC